MKPGADGLHIPSVADTIVRYDVHALRAEVRVDFSPEAGSQRLLKQSEISARFRKRPAARPVR
jgi:hypothetical protein